MNKIIISGRLARDPEVKQTKSGTSVCNATVAVDRGYKDKDGNRQADFIDVTAYSYTADFIGKYFKKGNFIILNGTMESNKWEDKEGHKRISWFVHVDNAEFGGSKPEQSFSKPSVDEGFEGAADEDPF